MNPSFSRMITVLNKKEKTMVTKQSLIEMEHEIITQFGFDFNFNCHGIFVDRYLRILDFHNEDLLLIMSNELCKFSLNEDKFLNYNPSLIAACSVILSINIFKREDCSLDNTG